MCSTSMLEKGHQTELTADAEVSVISRNGDCRDIDKKKFGVVWFKL